MDALLTHCSVFCPSAAIRGRCDALPFWVSSFRPPPSSCCWFPFVGASKEFRCTGYPSAYVPNRAAHLPFCLPSAVNESADDEAQAAPVQTYAYKPKTTHVKFMLQKECEFGEQFLMVGDDILLGSWDPLNAFPLEWSDGHIWTVELDLPVGRVVKFKFLLRNTSGQVYWQPGPDRIIEARDTGNTIVVSEDWDDAEKQMISEETSAISSENGILMGSELRNHVEEMEEMDQKSNADEDANINNEEKPSNLEQGPLLVRGLEHLPSNLEEGPLLVPDLEHLPSKLEEGHLLVPGLENFPSNLEEGPLLVPGLEHLPSNLEEGPLLVPGLEHLPLSESGLAEVSNPPEQGKVEVPRGNIAVEGTMTLSEEQDDDDDVECDDSTEAASSCDALAEESTPAERFREPNNAGWDFQWLKKLLPTIVFDQDPPVS